MNFTWPVRIYYEDTDSGGVVYYANYLKFMERSRTEFLRSKNLEQSVLKDDFNCLFVVTQANLKFIKPAKFDDLLSVSANITNQRKISFTFEHSIMRRRSKEVENLKNNPSDELLCSVLVKVACVDAKTLKPKRIPQQLGMLFNDHSLTFGDV